MSKYINKEESNSAGVVEPISMDILKKSIPQMPISKIANTYTYVDPKFIASVKALEKAIANSVSIADNLVKGVTLLNTQLNLPKTVLILENIIKETKKNIIKINDECQKQGLLPTTITQEYMVYEVEKHIRKGLIESYKDNNYELCKEEIDGILYSLEKLGYYGSLKTISEMNKKFADVWPFFANNLYPELDRVFVDLLKEINKITKLRYQSRITRINDIERNVKKLREMQQQEMFKGSTLYLDLIKVLEIGKLQFRRNDFENDIYVPANLANRNSMLHGYTGLDNYTIDQLIKLINHLAGTSEILLQLKQLKKPIVPTK